MLIINIEVLLFFVCRADLDFWEKDFDDGYHVLKSAPPQEKERPIIKQLQADTDEVRKRLSHVQFLAKYVSVCLDSRLHYWY